MTTDPYQKLNLDQIRLDGGTQPRESINDAVVAEYAAAIAAGDDFPPVHVLFDGVDYWLYDGFHRFHAHGRAGKSELIAHVRKGTKQDARDLANTGSMNAKHGIRETLADRRRRVANTLADHPDWSDHKVAEHCHVGRPLVADVRASSNPLPDAPRTVTRGGQTFTMKVASIGKTKPDPEPAPAASIGDTFDVTLDANGDPIEDPAIADVFDRVGEIEAIQNRVQAIRDDVKALAGTSIGAYLQGQQADANLKNVWTALKFCTPHVVCPKCKGRKCKACRQVGWIPQETAKRIKESE